MNSSLRVSYTPLVKIAIIASFIFGIFGNLQFVTANNTNATQHAARLNNILDKLLKQTDQIKSNLEYLGQALNKGAIKTDSKKELYRWITQCKEAVSGLQNQHSLPLLETDLYKTAYGIDILAKHISQIITNNFANIETIELPVLTQRSQLEPSLVDIEKRVLHNTVLLDKLRTETNNAGLTWVNKTARWLDKLNDTYQIVPLLETKLPITVALSITGLFFAPNRWFLDFPNPPASAPAPIPGFKYWGISKLKYLIGTSQLDPDIPVEKRKTTKGRNEHYEPTGYMDYILDIMQNPDIQAATTLASGVILWSLSKKQLPYVSDIRAYLAREWDKLKGFTVPNTSNSVIVEGITLDDEALIGIENQIAQLRDLVLYITNPEIYDRSNSKLEKGILLTGPSGNGKTYLARALCGHLNKYARGSAKYRFKELKWDEITWNTEGIKTVIEQAKRDAPCVLFIDEIHNLRLQTKEGGEQLTQFLTGMSGINSENDAKHQVILLAATNHPELLDPALLRPGRFGTIIRFEKPNFVNRKKYFSLVFKRNSIDTTNMDIDALARQTENCSYSDLESIVQISRFKALSLAQGVSQEHLQDRIDKQVYRLKDDVPATEQEKNIIAAHLGGQALMHMLLGTNQKIEFVTIRGRWSKIEENRLWGNTNKNQRQAPIVQDAKPKFGLLCTSNLHESIRSESNSEKEKLGKIMTAGYLSEQVILGASSNSYHKNDRQKALCFAKSLLLNGLQETDLSKQQLNEYKNKAYELLNKWEQDTLKTLEDHQDVLNTIVEKLAATGTLRSQDLQDIIKNHSIN